MKVNACIFQIGDKVSAIEPDIDVGKGIVDHVYGSGLLISTNDSQTKKINVEPGKVQFLWRIGDSLAPKLQVGVLSGRLLYQKGTLLGYPMLRVTSLEALKYVDIFPPGKLARALFRSTMRKRVLKAERALTCQDNEIDDILQWKAAEMTARKNLNLVEKSSGTRTVIENEKQNRKEDSVVHGEG